MTVHQGSPTFSEDRSSVREEVHHRTRAFGPDAKPFNLLIANISGSGLMGRCEVPYAAGDRITVAMPVIGATTATIRWSLGGRIGCEFDLPIGPAEYFSMLAVLVRS